MRYLQHILDPLIELILPPRCAGCGGIGSALCGRCVPAAPVLEVEHRDLRLIAACDYRGALRDALVAYKDRGRIDLAGPLAGLLAAAVRGLAPGPRVMLVGVASAPAVARARGGDHVARLARLAATECGLPAAPRRRPVLRQVRAVRDSAGLGAAARRANVARSMLAAAPVPGSPGGPGVILIDDIVTTGSTLGEAARALEAAGWVVHGAAVVAATPAPGAPVRSR
jgi:predicted amidophosphoribosyltransferase